MDLTRHSATKLGWPFKRGTVFISYRRSDSLGYGGRLRKDLKKQFKLFRDLEDIDPGDEFPTAIQDAVSGSSVMLVIVGPDWLHAEDAEGTMRLSNPDDYVRREILTALDHRLRVIPVLVGKASMPSLHELPVCLQAFATFNAFELSEAGWDDDLKRLVNKIRPTVDPWLRVRRISFALVAIAALVAGIITTGHIREGLLINKALKTAREGQVKAGLGILDGLEDKKTPDNTNPKVYLAEAEIYQMEGNARDQNAAAVQAAKLGSDRKDDYVVGRAMGLACDAKGKLGIPEALLECQQAQEYSERAGDLVGQVRAINARGSALGASKKPEEALAAYQEALEFAQQHSLLLDQYGALNNIGLILADQGQTEEAKAKFDLAAKGFKEEPGEASNAYNNLGTLSLDQGNIGEARRYFERARDLAVNRDKAREAQARLNLGLILEQAGALNDAQVELSSALEIYHNLGRESDVGFADNALGDIYLQQAKFYDAGKAYTEAKQLREPKEPGAHALSVTCLANLDFQQGHSTATDLLGRINGAIEEAVTAGDSYSEAFARVIKSRLLLQLSNIADANKEAAAALALAKRDKQPDNEVSARIVLAEILARKGNTRQALDELEELKTSTLHDENVGQNLEAQLASLEIMKRNGTPKQRSDADVLLSALQGECQGKTYILLASKAQAILAKKA